MAAIATMSSQTQFTLTDGPDFDDAFNGQTIVLYDVSNSDYPSVRVVSDYAGATKTVTIDSAAGFHDRRRGRREGVCHGAGGRRRRRQRKWRTPCGMRTSKSHTGRPAARVRNCGTAKAMVSNRRTHTVSTGVDQVFADDGSTLLRTMTPSG